MPKVKAEPTTLWKGPEVDGITQSMLSRFLCCRERFRIKYVIGLQPIAQFIHRMEYGQMWHTCEEALAQDVDYPDALFLYVKELCEKYPEQQQQIDHWYRVCLTQFPIYAHYWKKHKDVKDRTPIFQEQTFNIPYELPSGRVVRLRGKWDAVDLIGKGKSAAYYLQENKTKGEIVEEQIKKQLGFDLQAMIYLTALTTYLDFEGQKLAGVRYNVVRRPLSGGKGSIRQHKPTKSKPQGETKAEYYTRLGGIIKEDPGYYFMRWKAEITAQDLDNFQKKFLDPILEQLCDWWDWVECNGDTPLGPKGIHWQHPYGVYNVLNEGGHTELDEYMETGSKLGLERVETLFTELE